MSKVIKDKYIEEIETAVKRAELNLGFTKYTLKEYMKDESKEEVAKVKMNIDQQEQQIETNKRFLTWLKNQK